MTIINNIIYTFDQNSKISFTNKEKNKAEMNNQGVNNFSLSQLKEKVILNQVIGVEDEVFLLDESFYDLQLFNYPCRIDIMLAALCTKGKMKIKINLKEYEITEGMLALYTPSNIIQIDYTNNFNAKVIVASTQFMKSIHIDIKNILPLYMQVHNQSCQALDREYIQLYNKFFNLTKQIIQSPNITHKLEVVQGLISSVCYALMDGLHKSNTIDTRLSINQNMRQTLLFEQFMTILNDYHQTERSVGFYADKLNITPKYLSKLIKEISAKSAAEWIDQYVVLEAQTLLKYSDMTIKEIADYLNFASQSFFCKYFKHQTGITPGDYKKS
jgi:AraC-like DNA-binding protein